MAFERLRENLQRQKAEAALKGAIKQLDFSEGFRWQSPDAGAVGGVTEYLKALHAVDDAVGSIIDRPKSIFWGKGPKSVKLHAEIHRRREPPKEAYYAQITKSESLETPDFLVTLGHIVHIVGHRAHVPVEVRRTYIDAAVNAWRHQGKDLEIHIGPDWNLLVLSRRLPTWHQDQKKWAEAYLIPVAHREYTEEWIRDHRKPIWEAAKVGTVHRKFMNGARTNYRLETVNLTEWIKYFDIGNREDAFAMLELTGWRRLDPKVSDLLVKHLRTRNLDYVYHHKYEPVHHPLLGVKMSSNSLLLCAVTTPELAQDLQDAYYKKFAREVHAAFWDRVREAQETGLATVDVSPKTLAWATLARTNQALGADYMELEAPALSRMAAVMLRDEFSAMISPFFQQLAHDLARQIEMDIRSGQSESGITFGWHPEAMGIKVPVSEIIKGK